MLGSPSKEPSCSVRSAQPDGLIPPFIRVNPWLLRMSVVKNISTAIPSIIPIRHRHLPRPLPCHARAVLRLTCPLSPVPSLLRASRGRNNRCPHPPRHPRSSPLRHPDRQSPHRATIRRKLFALSARGMLGPRSSRVRGQLHRPGIFHWARLLPSAVCRMPYADASSPPPLAGPTPSG